MGNSCPCVWKISFNVSCYYLDKTKLSFMKNENPWDAVKMSRVLCLEMNLTEHVWFILDYEMKKML